MYKNNDFTFYYQEELLNDITTSLQADQEFNHLLKPIYLHKILYFISYLYLKPIVDKRYQSRGEFIHISSDMMVNLYGRTFNGTILKALLQYGFIDKSEKNY